jgi:hypothetical protein
MGFMLDLKPRKCCVCLTDDSVAYQIRLSALSILYTFVYYWTNMHAKYKFYATNCFHYVIKEKLGFRKNALFTCVCEI